MKNIVIVTEANEKVASGHLMECIEIAAVLREHKYNVSFFVNDDIDKAFLERIPFSYRTYSRNLQYGCKAICQTLITDSIDLVIFNFRRIEDDLLRYIRQKYSGTVLCIDELGHRHLSCNIIVNPMIDAYYHVYDDLDAKLYAGAKYLILSRKIQDYHKREKKIRENIQRICISMGGVDPFGTTVKLAKWIPEILPQVSIDIILGGGFLHWDVLKPIIKGKSNVSVYKNIDYVYELFFDADLVFCAGGNTLHELACIGAPTIIIPSMPHEVRNAKMFENYGFGAALPITGDITKKDVENGIIQVIPRETRLGFMKNGRLNFKGEGVFEFLKIIEI